MTKKISDGVFATKQKNLTVSEYENELSLLLQNKIDDSWTVTEAWNMSTFLAIACEVMRESDAEIFHNAVEEVERRQLIAEIYMEIEADSPKGSLI